MSLKQTRLLMGMPITVEVVDQAAQSADLDDVFAYFEHIDQVFSTYKPTSEISRINQGSLRLDQASDEVRLMLGLGEQTKKQTAGYFDMYQGGRLDPSGIVKGWAIEQAAGLLRGRDRKNFYVDAGGDIAVTGHSRYNQPWQVGIRNPWNRNENVKILSLTDCGVATSGTYIRGDHIWDPKTGRPVNEIVSLTVIGPNVYDADRFATAAFAMGAAGIAFIEQLSGFEAYQIDAEQRATMTSGFQKFI